MQSRESELLAVVADEAVRLALDGGASVEGVAGAAAERLDDAAEGIAVSLRFPVPEPGRAAHGIAANR